MYQTKPEFENHPPKEEKETPTRPFGTYPSRGESGEARRPWKAAHEVDQAAIESVALASRQVKLFRASKVIVTALGLSHFLVRA